MKFTIHLGVVLFTVAVISPVAADSISSCAQMCINNMVAKAGELGCGSTNIPCLCSNPDFANGLHDCTVEACGSNDFPAVEAYGASFCSSNSQATSGSAGATTASVKTTIVGTAASTSGVSVVKTNGSSSTATGSENGTSVLVPVTTEAKFSTFISGSITSVKSLGNTTIYSTAPPSLTNGTTPSSTSGASGSGGSGSGGSGSSGSGSKSSSSSAAAHPLATVASGAAGVLGLAALLIL